MISEDVKITIGEMLRLEKNKNADMLYDLMLYGELKDEDGNTLIPNTIKQENEKETVLGATIDLTGDKAKIYHKVKNNETGEINEKQVKVYYCNRDDCRHNIQGTCMTDPVNKYGKVCSKKDNWQYFEERE